jgi:hypothetical protein
VLDLIFEIGAGASCMAVQIGDPESSDWRTYAKVPSPKIGFMFGIDCRGPRNPPAALISSSLILKFMFPAFFFCFGAQPTAFSSPKDDDKLLHTFTPVASLLFAPKRGEKACKNSIQLAARCLFPPFNLLPVDPRPSFLTDGDTAEAHEIFESGILAVSSS